MSLPSTKLFAPLLRGAGAAVVLLGFATAVSASDGPFTNLAGAWAGSGTITSSGTKERIRCKATYSVTSTGSAMTQSLRCASDSYKFDVQSSIISSSGSISGSWNELTRNVNGSVSGHASSTQIDGSVDGIGFSATLAVTTHGNDQSVTIRPKQTDVTEVAIKLHR